MLGILLIEPFDSPRRPSASWEPRGEPRRHDRRPESAWLSVEQPSRVERTDELLSEVREMWVIACAIERNHHAGPRACHSKHEPGPPEAVDPHQRGVGRSGSGHGTGPSHPQTS